MFQNYLQLETKNEQDLFLQQNIEKVSVARRSKQQLAASLEEQPHSIAESDPTSRPKTPTPSASPEQQPDPPAKTDRKTRIRGATYHYFLPTKDAGKLKVCLATFFKPTILPEHTKYILRFARLHFKTLLL